MTAGLQALPSLLAYDLDGLGPFRSSHADSNPIAFAHVATLALASGEEIRRAAVIDSENGFAYFGTINSPTRIVKIDLTTFERVGSLIVASRPFFTAAIDSAKGFAYFGADTSPGSIVKVDLQNFTVADTLTLNPGEDRIASSIIDSEKGFAYFGTFTPSARIVKVDLTNFTRVEALDVGEDYLPSAGIDNMNGFAYFGTSVPLFPIPEPVIHPARIVKVDLTNFTRVTTLELEPGEVRAGAIVVDPVSGFAYVGVATNLTIPGIVVKIDLDTFERVGAVTLEEGENSLRSGVIDPQNGFAYFGTWTLPGRVAKIHLENLTRVDAITLESVEERNLLSAVIDPERGYAYFGAWNDPGRVVKILVGPDTLAPVLSAPEEIVEEATGPDGAVVTFEVTATDVVDSSPDVDCDPASGSTFPLGTTMVNCTATDSAGNTDTASFTVTVKDETPPELTLPAPVVKEATSPEGAVVTYTATASDLVDGPIAPVCDPPSGSTFPLGPTEVTCTATDSSENTETASFPVTVKAAPGGISPLVLPVGLGIAAAAVMAVAFYVLKRRKP